MVAFLPIKALVVSKLYQKKGISYECDVRINHSADKIPSDKSYRSRINLCPHKLSSGREYLRRIILPWKKTHFTTLCLNKIYMLDCQFQLLTKLILGSEVPSCERFQFHSPNAYCGFPRHPGKEKF